jgi:hypothetical protein
MKRKKGRALLVSGLFFCRLEAFFDGRYERGGPSLCYGPFAAAPGINFSLCCGQSRANRNLRAFAITETELKLIAAAAITGLSRMPNAG